MNVGVHVRPLFPLTHTKAKLHFFFAFTFFPKKNLIPSYNLLLQFFADVKEAEDKMKKMQDNMKKKYTCDRSTTATRLEDLLQDALVGFSCFH